MDWFSLFMDGLCLGGQGVMHIIFAGRLTGKKQKLWHFAAYILLLAALRLIPAKFDIGGAVSIAVGVLGLYAVSRFWMGNQRSVSWLVSVLAFYISQY